MPRRREQAGASRRFFNEFKVEILAAIAILAGIFLLVEPFEIRASLRAWLERALDEATVSGQRIGQYISGMSLSDLTGWLLVIFSAVFIAWRVRYRIQKSAFRVVEDCPRCGGSLYRIRRRSSDRLLCSLTGVELGRYHCHNAECGWEGLRRRSESSLHHHAGTAAREDMAAALQSDTRPQRSTGERAGGGSA